jgi:hypothetical protein
MRLIFIKLIALVSVHSCSTNQFLTSSQNLLIDGESNLRHMPSKRLVGFGFGYR